MNNYFVKIEKDENRCFYLSLKKRSTNSFVLLLLNSFKSAEIFSCPEDAKMRIALFCSYFSKYDHQDFEIIAF